MTMEIHNIPTARAFIRAWRSESITRQIGALTRAAEGQRMAAGLIPRTITTSRNSPTARNHTAASMVLFREAVALSEQLAAMET